MESKRYTTFEEAKTDWLQLEQTIEHYPFQSYWYNQLFAEKFCDQKDVHILGIYDGSKLLAIGAFEVVNDTVLFIGMKQVLGRQDITDYGDILFASESDKVPAVWQAIQDYFSSIEITTLQLDFVRGDSKTYQVLSQHAMAKVTKQDVSPYIKLPQSWDEYLSTLDKKDRHELKRKIRRLESETAFQLCTDETIRKEFDEFIRLHRLSDPDKEKFMSKDMEDVFWHMVTAEKISWQVHICSLIIDNKHVASVFMFVNSNHMLLYNSGFDQEYKYFSVGLLIHAFLIKRAVEEKKRIYDFLRGSERYKYDLGAIDMPLYQITLSLP